MMEQQFFQRVACESVSELDFRTCLLSLITNLVIIGMF